MNSPTTNGSTTSVPAAPTNEHRCRRLITEAIERFQLDLAGQVVLTEAAAGYYLLTPLIAARAGANRVLALAKDSRFGRAVDVAGLLRHWAERWGLAERVGVLLSRHADAIGEADIVTNLGAVRPLHQPFLDQLKPTAVIPLMWETWEYRPEDLDLEACRSLGLAVLGTNEGHADLRIFEYLGHLVCRLLLEADVEIFRSKIVVVGGGPFVREIGRFLGQAGAAVTVLPADPPGRLTVPSAAAALRRADALVVAEHHDRRLLLGRDAEITPQWLQALNPGLVIAHVCGGADRAAFAAAEFPCVPARFAAAGYMSVSLDYLGPRPMVDLHTAGLKVGQELARARASGFTAWDAECAVLASTSLAQGFAGYHPQERGRS